MIAEGSGRSDDNAGCRPVPGRSTTRGVPLAWLLALLVGVTLAIELGGEPLRQTLRYQRSAVEAGQWWRLVSGNLAHLGWYHWFVNAAALTLLGWLAPQRITVAAGLLRVVWLALGVTLGLHWFVPELAHYVGMSGVIHGLYLLALVPLARRGDRLALACLLLVLAKLAYEQWTSTSLGNEELIGGRVITEAHLFGAVAALLYLSAAFAIGHIRKQTLLGERQG